MASKSSARADLEDEELLQLEVPGCKAERVDGEIVVSPAGWQHGLVGARLLARLAAHVEAQGLGYVFGPDTGFKLASGNVRSPDVSFVAAGRLPADAGPFPGIAPDLAVEILSPSERVEKVRAKVEEYLGAGVRLVWLIDLQSAGASAHREAHPPVAVGAGGFLDGEQVVPGFRVRLRELFEGLAA